MPNDISQNPSRHSFRRVFEIEILTRLNIRKSYHIFSYTSLKKTPNTSLMINIFSYASLKKTPITSLMINIFSYTSLKNTQYLPKS